MSQTERKVATELTHTPVRHRWTPPSESAATRPISLFSGSSFRGVLVNPRTNREIMFESKLERDAIYILMANPDVAEIREQPAAVTYVDADGVTRSHTFDLEARTHTGIRHSIAVKYESQVETSGIVEVVRLIDAQRPAGCGDFVHLRTDRHITEVRADNARLIMRAYRFRVQTNVDQMREFVRSLNGAATISSILRASIPGSDGYLALLCLIAKGDLIAIGDKSLSMMTLVRRPSANAEMEGI